MSVNSQINLISSEVLIGEFLQDYDMTSTDFISRLNRHIVRAIELMNIDTYFKRCVRAFITEECRTIIPCSAKYIEAVVLNAGGAPRFLDLTNNQLRLLSKDNLNGKSEVYGYVEGSYLNFKSFDGQGFVVYKGLPTTNKGYVQVPDDGLVIEAIMNFIVFKLSLSGYKHKEVSRKEARQEWERLYPMARNSVNFPTPHDIERYTIMTTSPLKGDVDRVETLGLEDFGGLPNISIADAYPSLINKFYSFETLAEAFGVDEWSSTEL